MNNFLKIYSLALTFLLIVAILVLWRSCKASAVPVVHNNSDSINRAVDSILDSYNEKINYKDSIIGVQEYQIAALEIDKKNASQKLNGTADSIRKLLIKLQANKADTSATLTDCSALVSQNDVLLSQISISEEINDSLQNVFTTLVQNKDSVIAAYSAINDSLKSAIFSLTITNNKLFTDMTAMQKAGVKKKLIAKILERAREIGEAALLIAYLVK